MPDYYNDNVKQLKKEMDNQFAPYGDVSMFALNGVVSIPNGVARANGDRDRICRLQNGIVVLSVDFHVRNGLGAAGTFDLGHRQIAPPRSNQNLKQFRDDWVDDPDYLLDGQSFQSAGQGNTFSLNGHRPLYVNRSEVWLEITWRTAISNAQDVEMDMRVWYRTKGQP